MSKASLRVCLEYNMRVSRPNIRRISATKVRNSLNIGVSRSRELASDDDSARIATMRAMTAKVKRSCGMARVVTDGVMEGGKGI